MKNCIKKILKIIGLADIVLIFLNPSRLLTEIDKLSVIKAKINDLSIDEVDKAILYSNEILISEANRGEKIEGKANNLLQITGLTSGLIVGIISFLSDSIPLFSPQQINFICITFLLVIVSLIFSILLSYRVLAVENYSFSELDIDDVYKYHAQTLIKNEKERLASIIYSKNHNCRIHNAKATFLIASQKWFRNAVLLMLVLSIIIISCFAFTIPNYERTSSPSIHNNFESKGPSLSITSTPKPPERNPTPSPTIMIQGTSTINSPIDTDTP